MICTASVLRTSRYRKQDCQPATLSPVQTFPRSGGFAKLHRCCGPNMQRVAWLCMWTICLAPKPGKRCAAGSERVARAGVQRCAADVPASVTVVTAVKACGRRGPRLGQQHRRQRSLGLTGQEPLSDPYVTKTGNTRHGFDRLQPLQISLWESGRIQHSACDSMFKCAGRTASQSGLLLLHCPSVYRQRLVPAGAIAELATG